jgi:hypothetical protein
MNAILIFLKSDVVTTEKDSGHRGRRRRLCPGVWAPTGRFKEVLSTP